MLLCSWQFFNSALNVFQKTYSSPNWSLSSGNLTVQAASLPILNRRPTRRTSPEGEFSPFQGSCYPTTNFIMEPTAQSFMIYNKAMGMKKTLDKSLVEKEYKIENKANT